VGKWHVRERNRRHAVGTRGVMCRRGKRASSRCGGGGVARSCSPCGQSQAGLRVCARLGRNVHYRWTMRAPRSEREPELGP